MSAILRTFVGQVPCARSLHTSAILHASQRKQHARSTRKLNTAKRDERLRTANANRPHVVLGTRPGDLTTWPTSDLAKVIIDQDTLTSDTDRVPFPHPAGTIWLPKYLGHGIGEEEKKLLFETLPALSVEASAHAKSETPEDLQEWITSGHQEAERRELAKANALATMLDLRNANARGLAFENRLRIIAEFSEPDNPFDTGRPEVQAALLTYRIRNLWSHLTKFKKDITNRRSLRRLVHERAKVLRYLRQTNRDRYEVALSRLALEPESVEGELVV